MANIGFIGLGSVEVGQYFIDAGHDTIAWSQTAKDPFSSLIPMVSLLRPLQQMSPGRANTSSLYVGDTAMSKEVILGVSYEPLTVCAPILNAAYVHNMSLSTPP